VSTPFSGRVTVPSSTGLDMASRINAKVEKRKRNRENMRKFKKGGRRGTSKKKMMRKVFSSAARQVCICTSLLVVHYGFWLCSLTIDFCCVSAGGE
jgi:hypothetical protein